MKKLVKRSALVMAGLALLGMLSSVDAAFAFGKGKGNGRMLRDGSCINSKTATQQNNTTRGRYGDGTQPRPMDGTGFGAKK